MSIDDYMMTLVDRDTALSNIANQIKEKQRILIQKYKEYQSEKNTNKFAASVKADYEKYYNFIVDEKKRQIDAMEQLDKYVNDVNAATDDINKHNTDAETEHKHILDELSDIKHELSDIIDI